MFGPKDDGTVLRVKRFVAVPALRPEFERFLYAPIAQSNDEMPFSVLSALARQNLDPWEEAEKLSQLSPESAVARLASMLPPIGASLTKSERAEIAARLVALLPRTRRLNIPPFDKLAARTPRDVIPIVICLIVGAMLLASALLGN